ncbi:MAG: FAD-dependent oxidoreductase [Dysgonamonadaceae bacterium]|jgi:protoporphyrinogen oxidase|nr:FAD-dependent oxidoreductase [Dysgonamonadaceae bacterium]
MNLILGGGIAGISAAYHLQKNGKAYKLCEKNHSWGGLCDNFTISGFLFDYFVHLSFTTNDCVKELFSQSTPFYTHNPLAYNYYKGKWIKHPAQNNLSPLSTDEKIRIIQDFINKPVSNPQNYEEWLLVQFGDYFTNNFPSAYTRKYWTANAKDLGLDWVGERFSLPELSDILRGAFEEQADNFYYAKEMRYPVKGGYKAFLNKMADQIDISVNKEAVLIDTDNKQVEFSDGTKEYYTRLVSSVPLPELVKLIKDCPASILDAGKELTATSGQLVSIGFNRPDIPQYLWAYIYDEDIFPARVYSPSLKSKHNAPEGKSSLQFETYCSKYSPKKCNGDGLTSHIIEKGERMNLFVQKDIDVIDYREVKYANVVFDHKRQKAVSVIHTYLQNLGINYIGRFGEWDYLWSDQSLLSGMDIINYK